MQGEKDRDGDALNADRPEYSSKEDEESAEWRGGDKEE